MSKFSKSQWEIKTNHPEQFGSAPGWDIYTVSGKPIAVGEAPFRCIHSEVNAHLLVSAPELLKALKMELTKRCGKGPECEVCGGNGTTLPYHESCCAVSRAAVAKAEGRMS